MNGFLIIDKPEGITSHDVVAAIRAVTGIKKVGHTGTLDPFATGVLAVALGTATRAIEFLDESIKIYDATIQLGTTTDTGDPTGEVVRTAEIPALDRGQVEEVLASFLGDRMQTPPPYSAVKFKGKPLYWYARRGETVEVPSRAIHVHRIELTELGTDYLRILVTCSRGTYARVLADEIATALGTAGHLRHLARARSGPFFLKQALTFEQLAEIVSAEPERTWQEVLLKGGTTRVAWKPRDVVRNVLAESVMPLSDALSHLPLVTLDEREARRIGYGHLPSRLPTGVPIGGRYLLASGAEVLAIGELATDGAALRKVLGDR